VHYFSPFTVTHPLVESHTQRRNKRHKTPGKQGFTALKRSALSFRHHYRVFSKKDPLSPGMGDNLK
jgi:hypothetical protein